METSQFTKKLKNTRICILGRFDAPTDYLDAYLRSYASNLTCIKINPDPLKQAPLVLMRSTKNRQKKIHHTGIKHLFFSYAKTLLFTLHIFLINRCFDVVIGVGPFNGMVASLYAFLKGSSQTVYYIEDNVSYLHSGLSDRLIKWCDSTAKKRCKHLWFINEAHMLIYQDREIQRKSRYVPEPIRVVKTKRPKKIKTIVFIGSLDKEQGVEMLFNAFLKLSHTYPNLHLRLIGDGPIKNMIQRIVKRQRLSSRVETTGFIQKRKKILENLSSAHIGVAPYNPHVYKNLQFGQSSKISNYIGCGIPTVATHRGSNTPSMGKLLQEYAAGYLIPYNENKLIKCIEILLKNPRLYKKMCKNTTAIAKQFRASTIYKSALEDLVVSKRIN